MNILKQNINILIALTMVASVGIGASYIIVRVANATEFSYLSTYESITITAEFQKPRAKKDTE